MNEKKTKSGHFSMVYKKIAKFNKKYNGSMKKMLMIDKNLSRRLQEETIKPITSWTLHGLPNNNKLSN